MLTPLGKREGPNNLKLLARIFISYKGKNSYCLPEKSENALTQRTMKTQPYILWDEVKAVPQGKIQTT